MSEEIVQPQKPVGEAANNVKFDAGDYGASPFLQPEESAEDPYEKSVTWTASEYIVHHKNTAWYIAVVAAALVIATATYLLTHDKISMFTIAVVGILFCVAAARKPRVLTYTLDKDGLAFGQRFHAYSEFRSFSIIREGAFANIDLLPLKRFMPMISIYFSPEDEAAIVDILSEHVAFEERSHALIDRFMRQVRF